SRLFRADYAQPMIVELPLRCATDLEVTLFASSITITPGTLVAAIAAGTSTQPPVLFVHALFEDSEEDALAGLTDMESRLLAMTRGRAPGGGAESEGERSWPSSSAAARSFSPQPSSSASSGCSPPVTWVRGPWSRT